jgi:hypothetical protein
VWKRRYYALPEQYTWNYFPAPFMRPSDYRSLLMVNTYYRSSSRPYSYAMSWIGCTFCTNVTYNFFAYENYATFGRTFTRTCHACVKRCTQPGSPTYGRITPASWVRREFHLTRDDLDEAHGAVVGGVEYFWTDHLVYLATLKYGTDWRTKRDKRKQAPTRTLPDRAAKRTRLD